jgi:drug/metabolite transporter (DMT)-like permease
VLPTTDRTVAYGVAGGVLAATLYGGWAVVSRLGTLDALDPFDLTFLRFGVAALILLPVVLRQPSGPSGFAGVSWPRLAALTLFSGLPYGLLVYVGYEMIPAGHGAVILPGSIVVFSAAFAARFLGERIAGLRIVGLAAVLAGIVAIGGGSFAHGVPGQWRGHLMFVLAGAFWAAFTVAARAWRVPPVATTAFVTVASASVYVPLYLAGAGLRIADHALVPMLLQAGYQGVAVGVVAVIVYTKVVGWLGAARASAFTALVPAIATILAATFLGETVTAPAMVGLALVSLGMVASVAAGLGQAKR